jgi:molecular chaperone DnaK (HSP70)
LSANLEASVHLECVVEDEDLHRHIKRQEFEEMIQPLVDRFGVIL